MTEDLKEDLPLDPVSLCKSEIGCEPNVLGYMLLIKAIEVPEKKGSIILTADHIEGQKRRQNIGRVLKVGPMAFVEKNQDRKCEIGDWIHYSIFEREALYPNGHTCYYIADDKIFSIIKPEEVHMFLDDRK